MSRYKFDPNTGKLLAYNETTGEWRPDRSRKNANRVVAPSVMSDIREFIAHAGDKPVLIGSRSKLAAYERSNNIRQCGDYRKGEVIARRKKKVSKEFENAKAIGGDNSVTWSDFR